MNPEQPDPKNAWAESLRDLDEQPADKGALVEAECPWCGLVTIDVNELGCTASDTDARGLCQFVCPFCARLSTTSVTLLEVKTLIVAGARLVVNAPLELLEPKSGPALSWDDVLDFSLAFEIETKHS